MPPAAITEASRFLNCPPHWLVPNTIPKILSSVSHPKSSDGEKAAVLLTSPDETDYWTQIGLSEGQFSDSMMSATLVHRQLKVSCKPTNSVQCTILLKHVINFRQRVYNTRRVLTFIMCVSTFPHLCS